MVRRRALLTAALALAALPATAGAATPGAPAPGTPGALVPSFGAAAPPQTAGVVLGPVDSAYAAVVAHGDGFLVAGQEGPASGPRLIVARYLRDGRLDPGFGDGGIARGPVSFSGPAAGATNSSASGIALQPDGRIVVGGTLLQGSSAVGLLAERFTADGHLDGSYGSGGVAVAQRAAASRGAALALTSDGRAVVAGTTRLDDGSDAATVARWDASGQPDPSFDGDGVWQRPRSAGTQESVGRSVAVQGDGRIVLGGRVTNTFGAQQMAIGRMGPDGTLEVPLVGLGGSYSSVEGIALTTANDVIGVGSNAVSSSADAFALRRSSGGGLDPTFGSGGFAWNRAAPPSATVLTRPYPGATAVLVTPRTVYVGGTAEGSQYRIMALTALDAVTGTPISGFGATLGVDYQMFPQEPGTTYAFVNGMAEPATTGPGSSLQALARTADGRYLVGAGVAGSNLGGVTPSATRGVIALFTAIPEPAPGGGGPDGDGGTGGEPANGGAGGGAGSPAARIFDASLRPRTLTSRTRAQLRFRLDAAARSTLTVERLLPGRRQQVGRPARSVCRAPTPRNARRPRCTRVVAVAGKVSFSGVAGNNRRTVTRRLLGKSLRRGRYRLVVRVAGGTVARIGFTVR
ncbi:hypothetical protein [Patulibacter defluvii]|uniref:hypothetical protein n=1 Tax=Patulibacter defluvii TaxID=3095358 RepID=UPI002A75FAB4|nr:hypothetical protein [Patulibacter sp. DM4]